MTTQIIICPHVLRYRNGSRLPTQDCKPVRYSYLWRGVEDPKSSVQVLVKLQDSSHIPAPKVNIGPKIELMRYPRLLPFCLGIHSRQQICRETVGRTRY